jgi:hypothetical protein
VKVLLVVIDAATPRVVCPAVQTGRLPNLKRLADAGEMHQACVTMFPSITPAATTSIITGTYPFEHGIAGASWFDDARGEVAYYGDDFWVIARKGFGHFLQDFLVRLNGDRLTAPTLFEVVERAGKRAASVNYLVHRGLVTHTINVPWLLALLPGVPLTDEVLGPQTLCLGDFVDERPANQKLTTKGSGVLHRFGMDDAGTAVRLQQLAADGALPDLTVAYFADNDYRSHEVGPAEALPVVERVDAALGAVFDAAGGFDRFMQDTCVIVTSDHGHCEIGADRSAAVIELNHVLEEFRQAELGRAWRDDDEIMICPNMRATQIYVQRPTSESVARVARVCLRDPRVDLTMWREVDGDSHRYHVIGPRGELAFWRGTGGAGEATDAWGTAWAWRGNLDVLLLQRDGSTLESTEYPNAFERLTGVLDLDKSGEIWVNAQPGCEFEVQGGKAHCGGASHGGLHALESLTPVIVANAPRVLPTSLRSIDLAALCLHALGIESRYDVGAPRIQKPSARGDLSMGDTRS